MTEIIRREVRLPFPGFYETLLDAEFERPQEEMAESLAEEHGATLEHVNEALFWALDHSNAYHEIAREYAETFGHILKTSHGEDLELAYVTMESPKAYNFETDKVFVTLPRPVIERMRKETPDEVLARHITERHSSRSGFISFYPNHLDAWNTKPLQDWDHNELDTLLRAWLEAKEIDLKELEDDIRERLSTNGKFDNALSEAFDEARFKERLAEAQNKEVDSQGDTP